MFFNKGKCHICKILGQETVYQVRICEMYGHIKMYLHESCIEKVLNDPESYTCRQVDYVLQYVNERERLLNRSRKEHAARIIDIRNAKEKLGMDVNMTQVCED